VRVILFILGLFILGNLIVVLMPKADEVVNQNYQQRSEIAPDSISVVAKRMKVKPVVDGVVDGLKRSSVGATDKKVTNKVKLDVAAVAVQQRKKCYRVGPFMHMARLSVAKSKLTNLDLDFDEVQRPSAAAEVFRIYLGPYADSKRAADVRRELTAKGIFDHFQRKEGDGKYVVSLGIYSRAVSAQGSLERFLEEGVDARIRPERTVLPASYWLNIVGERTSFPLESMRGIDWGEHSARFGRYSC